MGQEKRTRARRRAASILALAALAALAAYCTWTVGGKILELAGNPEAFRAWAQGRGLWARTELVGMVFAQIVLAFIPGEPIEILAGYAFGPVEGTLLCLVGDLLGSAAVFLFVRRCGRKLVQVFFDPGKIRALRFLQREKQRDLLVFVLFFVPGTPKDLLTYFVGLTPMGLTRFLLLSTVGRIPSVVTSTLGGDALGTRQYALTAAVFLGTAVVSAGGLFLYARLTRKKSREEKK